MRICRNGHLLFPCINDALEVGSLQRGTANKSTVDIRLGEKFGSIAWLAATSIEDGCVFSSLFAILVCHDRTNVGKHFFSLVACSCLAGADGPDGLVGKNDILPLLSCKVEYGTVEFSLDHLILFLSLALFERFTAAEDNLQAILESKLHFLLQNFCCLAIVLATL